MKGSDFFKDMVKKINKENDPAFSELLNLDVELPDDACNVLVGNLMSLEHAKSKLKGSLRAETLNGVDAKLAQIISDKLGLTIEFEQGTDTFQKFDRFAETIKEALEKKPEKSSEAEKLAKQYLEELQKERKERNTDREEAAKLLAQTKADNDARYMNDAKKNALRGKEWANKNVSEDTWIKVANESIEEALRKVGAKEVFEDGKLKLVLANDPTSPYFDEKGVTISHDDFVTRVITENKLIAVTEAPKPDNNSYTPVMNHPLFNNQQPTFADPYAARMSKQRQIMNEEVNKTLAAFSQNNKN